MSASVLPKTAFGSKKFLSKPLIVKQIRVACRTPRIDLFLSPSSLCNSISRFLNSLQRKPEDHDDLNNRRERVDHLLKPIQSPDTYSRDDVFFHLRDEVLITYRAQLTVLLELIKRTDFTDKENIERRARAGHRFRILDFGAGAGAGAWAVHSAISKFGLKTKFVGVEPHQTMQMVGKYMTSFIGKNMDVEWKGHLEANMISGSKNDIVLCSYVLGDLVNDEMREDTIKSLWETVAQNGFLVVIDRADAEGFNRVANARKWILEANPPSLTDPNTAHVVAPCPHDGPCPLYKMAKTMTWKNMICSHGMKVNVTELPAQSAIRSRARKSNDKWTWSYSFVVLRKGPSPRLRLPELEILRKTQNENELLKLIQQSVKNPDDMKLLSSPTPTIKAIEDATISKEAEDKNASENGDDDDDDLEEDDDLISDFSGNDVADGTCTKIPKPILLRHTYFYDRVIRKPLKKSQHVIVDVCSHFGKLQRFTITKSKGQNRYKQSKKIREGDLWSW